MSIPVPTQADDELVDCVFQRSWWLEAVAPGRWGSTEVERDGRVVARWPWVRRRVLGFDVLGNAPLTPYLGPTLARTEGGAPVGFALEMELVAELVRKLPRAAMVRQTCAPAFQNWLPLHATGFRQTTRYTFRLDDLSDPDRLWSGVTENVRRNVRKAGKELSVRSDIPIERILEIVRLTYARQGKTFPVPEALVRRLDAAARARGAVRAYGAEDAQGRLHAVGYVVEDRHCAYWLMAGNDPELRASGAGQLLAWEAIKGTVGKAPAFDFEGSMQPGISEFYRRFGAAQTPCHAVTSAGRALGLALALREAWDALRAPRASTQG